MTLWNGRASVVVAELNQVWGTGRLVFTPGATGRWSSAWDSRAGGRNERGGFLEGERLRRWLAGRMAGLRENEAICSRRVRQEAAGAVVGGEAGAGRGQQGGGGR